MEIIVWTGERLWNIVRGIIHVLFHPLDVWNLADPVAVMRVIYYGASAELLLFFILLTAGTFVAGLFRRRFLWTTVGVLEGFGNSVGRLAAWAGLVMVIQQIMVIFLQSIFRVSDIGIIPAGLGFSYPVGWWGDGLKLYNAMVVCLCCAYTFIQGGHVRVDLFYARTRHQTKRLIDMFGALVFMIPALVLMWYYSWFFMWRHLINPKVSSTDPLDRLIAKTRAFRWQPETIGFSPNGFNAYFLFKVLLVLFCLMMIVQAIAFFYRSYLEFTEGEEATNKNLDLDVLEQTETELPEAQDRAHGNH